MGFQGQVMVLCAQWTNLTIETNVSVKCCLNLGIGTLQQIWNCPKGNDSFQIKGNSTLQLIYNATWDSIMCGNASEIKNSSAWGDMVNMLNPKPIVRTEQIQRLPSTCINVAHQ